ncbi:Hypothetical predicted protein [Pelobates cultripes]|uniref:Uncharacterized protein n=1 Tax=Pelobates cultripes TaxID=61616 RepID=A0AAD1TAZ5_PELCU|nr:Hypothetical predicted protein [Pelobates cultripes]
MTMLQIVTFFTVLVLTGMQQVCSSSNDGNNKGLSSHQREVLSLMDKVTSAVRQLLDSKQHLEILKKVEDSMKDVICDSQISAQASSEIAKFLNGVLDAINIGKLDKNTVIKYLEKDPMKCVQKFKDKFLNKA